MTGGKPLYKTSEVCKILGLERSTIQYYCDRGIIKPFKKASGRGSFRQFSGRNIVEIAIAKQLVESGITLKRLPILFTRLNNSLKDLQRREAKERNVAIGDYLDPMAQGLASEKLLMCVTFQSHRLKEREISMVKVFKYNSDTPNSLDFDIHYQVSFLWINLSVLMEQVEECISDHSLSK